MEQPFALFGFVNPSLLHSFQNLFAAAGRVVVKFGQCQNQIAQLGKTHGFRVNAVAVAVVQGFSDLAGIGPFHIGLSLGKQGAIILTNNRGVGLWLSGVMLAP